MRGRVLVIDQRLPKPDQDSGSASTFSYLQVLSRAGFDVTFVPFDLKNDGRYRRALEDLGIRVLSEPEWTSIESVIDLQAEKFDILLLYRGPTAAAVFDRARHAAPNARIVFHAVDLHFLRMEREAASTGS